MQISFDIYRPLLKYVGLFWHVLVSIEICRSPLTYAHLFWYIQASFDICRSLLTRVFSFEIYQKNSAHQKNGAHQKSHTSMPKEPPFKNFRFCVKRAVFRGALFAASEHHDGPHLISKEACSYITRALFLPESSKSGSVVWGGFCGLVRCIQTPWICRGTHMRHVTHTNVSCHTQ